MTQEMPPQELVVEKQLASYRLPDDALDLSAWLRDGLEVYNLFVQMKPMFFAMLKAHGGEFKASWREMNADARRWRLTIGSERVGRPGEPDYDEVAYARLVDRTDVSDRHYDRREEYEALAEVIDVLDPGWLVRPAHVDPTFDLRWYASIAPEQSALGEELVAVGQSATDAYKALLAKILGVEQPNRLADV